MGHLVMSEKERIRLVTFELVKQRKISLALACQRCRLSYRQGLRLYQRYEAQGDEGLVHRSRGKSSNRSHVKRSQILKCYQEKYLGFGPTFAAEKLAEEEGLMVDHETLRIWLLKEGLWDRQRKRSPYRCRRARREKFGELLQIDGSIHDWFGDGNYLCLMDVVDDATGQTQALLSEGETTAAVFQILWRWIMLYGIPMAIYVDLKSVYVGRSENSFCHVERACQKLGIEIIKAYSPQAKGRVERKHAVFQDRFVKELRLKNIKTLPKANALLENRFLEKLNAKFSLPAACEQSAHAPLGDIDLANIFCWEYTRQLQNDWTFSFEGQCYQINKNNTVKPKQKIIVRRHLDSHLSCWHQQHRLDITLIQKPPKLSVHPPKKVSLNSPSQIGKMSKQRSPWRYYNPDWLKPAEHKKLSKNRIKFVTK